MELPKPFTDASTALHERFEAYKRLREENFRPLLGELSDGDFEGAEPRLERLKGALEKVMDAYERALSAGRKSGVPHEAMRGLENFTLIYEVRSDPTSYTRFKVRIGQLRAGSGRDKIPCYTIRNSKKTFND